MSPLMPAIGDTIDLGPRGEGIIESIDANTGKIVIRKSNGKKQTINTHDICLDHPWTIFTRIEL
jgi:hypothetical protein